MTFSEYVERALREGAMWTLMCVALYLVLSLASYAPEDPGWSYVGEAAQVTNAGGPTGAWFADVTLYLFGFFAYLLPLMLGFSAWVVFRGRDEEAKPRAWMLALRWIGFLVTLAAGCGYGTMHFAELGSGLPNGTGGGLGHLVSDWMLQHFNGSGTEILLAGTFLVGFTLFSGISWLALLHSVGDGVLQGMRLLWSLLTGGLGRLFIRRDPD
ncbi:MAG: DNA translocase FtsK 4TM domain-containing protein, partial [Chromatiaceae bacterium]